MNHPKWGAAIEKGDDLFLLATTKGKRPEDAVFPPVNDQASFKPAMAKDQDGTLVTLTDPPTDLPAP